ncbi:DJ-1/PfpI family protein [Kordiimonas sp. SCSIO 12603]|uniref:GlxA family transcriptional regulator n=1 Tax=Kordiimonas sp. SCSIO 12603 TaxID=2829596 RepID=UPI0021057853|nr:DJ-1/PfpI family protein [Kordiimonas sp. SCSIO 12603]UTW58483.1 DJ-1/PfpI family protein [Kordiimonas sp. SCSIO 12603]
MRQPHTIAVILFENLMPLDVVGPTDAFMVANYYWHREQTHPSDDQFYKYEFVSAAEETVTCLSGLKLHTSKTIANQSPDAFDTILVPGGNGVFTALENATLIEWLSMCRHKQRVMSVCSGSILLGEAGLLNGKTACSHWITCDYLRDHYPEVNVNPDALYMFDGNVITSAGVTAGIDMALAIIEKDLGYEIALATARRLVMHLKRNGNQSQFSWPMKMQYKPQSKRIQSVVHKILSELQTELGVDALAEHAGMSTRNFSRLFKQQIGETPAKFVEKSRLEYSRIVLEENQKASLQSIATVSGFSSGEQFSRSFERIYGLHPKDYSAQFKLQQESISS